MVLFYRVLFELWQLQSVCHSCIQFLKFQTSNSFYRDAGHRRRIDVGRVQLPDDKVDRYFLNVASLHL